MGNELGLILLLVFILTIVLIAILFISTEVYEKVYLNNNYRIIDGDTVEINGVVYRDMIIDAPEIGKNQKDRWVKEFDLNKSCMETYARLAMDFVEKNIKYVKTNGKKDKYNRTLAIFMTETQVLGLIMVEQGLAFCYYRSSRDSYTGQCLELEQKARSNRIGIWNCQLS